MQISHLSSSATRQPSVRGRRLCVGLCSFLLALAFPLIGGAQESAAPRAADRTNARAGNNASTPAQTARAITDQDITFAVEGEFQAETAVPWQSVDVTTEQGIVTLTGTVDRLLAKERANVLAQTVRGVRSVVNRITVQPPERTDDEIRRDVEAALATDPATDSYEINTSVEDGVVTLTGTANSYREQQLPVYIAKGVRGVRDVINELTLQYNENRPDAEVAADVRATLRMDAWVDEELVNVEVKNGKAMLSGTAGSAAGKSRIAYLTLATTGVRTLENNLKVDGAARPALAGRPGRPVLSDEAILHAIEDALLDDPRVLSFRPNVKVEKGFVTLSGTVDNLKAKRAAEQIARSTSGVINVRNYLKVRPDKAIPAEQLEENVRQALRRDPLVTAYEIAVQARNGVVTLTGLVDSDFERGTAEEVASRVNGVVDIRNRLKVEAPTLTYRRLYENPYFSLDPYAAYNPAVPIRSDAEIAQGIKDHLWWSPWVDAEEVQVAVEGGVATLTGKVDSWAELQSATENAFEGGALVVRNQLRVER